MKNSSVGQKLFFWLLATRPKTLVASIIPVSIGICLCIEQVGYDKLNFLLAILCYLFAILIQIATNFYNDYSDHLKGADRHRVLGPLRLSQKGLIEGKSLRNAAFFLLLLAFVIGLFMMEYSGANRFIILIGVASVLCALAYTGGPLPFAYNGLGDIFVVLFFGLIAVSTTHYILVIEVSENWNPNWTIPLGIGFLINNLLVVNNYRDWETDKEAGKNTTIVMFGKKFGILLYSLGILIPVIVSPLVDKKMEVVMWLLPVGIFLTYKLINAKSSKDFSLLLACTSLNILVYGILVGWSLTA